MDAIEEESQNQEFRTKEAIKKGGHMGQEQMSQFSNVLNRPIPCVNSRCFYPLNLDKQTCIPQMPKMKLKLPKLRF